MGTYALSADEIKEPLLKFMQSQEGDISAAVMAEAFNKIAKDYNFSDRLIDYGIRFDDPHDILDELRDKQRMLMVAARKKPQRFMRRMSLMMVSKAHAEKIGMDEDFICSFHTKYLGLDRTDCHRCRIIQGAD